MKTNTIITFILLIGITVLSSCDSEDNLGATSEEYNVAVLAQISETILAFPLDSLDAEEISGLELMREEEKLARDVYLHLYETWGIRIFLNISNSESTHMHTIKVLLDRYELEDPISEDVEGEFENSELAALFTSLTSFGDSSLVNAFRVGSTIEDLDIKDLMDLTEETDNEDILFAYDNLTRGSRNHIRSFVSKLNTSGESYDAQFISETLLDSILNTPKEAGNW